MNEQERNMLNMAEKYFEILHRSISDLENRIRALEQEAIPGGAKNSASAASLSKQLQAIHQEVVKILR